MSDRPHVLITGANRGLGLELARQFARRGADLILVNRTPLDPGTLHADHMDGAVVELLCDLADPGSLPAKLAEALSGRALSIVVNNAGIFYQAEEHGLSGLNLADIARMIAVNATAPALLIAAVAPYLARDAKIVNILSDMAFPETWDGTYPLYRATKAFLWSLTANRAGARDETIVIGIDPGWMRTDMGGADAPDDPVEVAAGIVALLDRPDRLSQGRVFGLRELLALPSA